MLVDLKNIPLFAGIDEGLLHDLAVKGAIKTFPKDAVVINEGDFTASLYVILEGRVKVCLGDECGKEVVLDIKGPGAYFGEMALDERARSASIVTLESSRFLVVAQSDFKQLMVAYPQISQHLIRNLIAIVRGLNKNIKSLVMRDVYSRVSRLLLDLAVEHDGKLVISEKLTQQDMASRVGSSRETINRIFRDLSVGGYIKVEGRKIIINKALPARW